MLVDHQLRLLDYGITYFGYSVDNPDVVELVDEDYEPEGGKKVSVTDYWSDEDVEDCTRQDYVELLARGVDGYDFLWKRNERTCI